METYKNLKKEIQESGFGNKFYESKLAKWLKPELW
jgi:hypothetical protein